MKTLADFKRALTPGSAWKLYHNLAQKDLGVRTVAKVQTKAVAFTNEAGGESWLEFPKAGQIKFPDANTAQIFTDSGLTLTYTKVEPRKARCTYFVTCKAETPSREGLPFFEQKPDREHDSYYCGCYGWE
jgi:hypothetical protein